MTKRSESQKAKYGEDYFKEIGRRGGQRTAERTDMKELGKKGGDTTLARHGRDYFRDIRVKKDEESE